MLAEGRRWCCRWLHELRRYSLRDQVYRPTAQRDADGDGAVPDRRGAVAGRGRDGPLRAGSAIASPRRPSACPTDVGHELIEPVVDGVLHRALAQHTVREIFTDKRVEIQQDVEQRAARAAGEGRRRRARASSWATSTCPTQYRAGPRGRCSPRSWPPRRCATRCELKEKQVKETALEGEADKVRREKAAEAAGAEEIIAAKAQEPRR